MRVLLMHRDRDLDVRPELRDAVFEAMVSGHVFGIANAKRNRRRGEAADEPPPASVVAVTQDLGLETLWDAMAAGDEYLWEAARRVMLSSVADPGDIEHRQHVLADCLERTATVRELYDLAIEALENERRSGGIWTGDRPDAILRRSVQLLTLHLDVLTRLRGLVDEQAPHFRSGGFRRFFAMLQEELTDDYLETLRRHLGELEFKRGVLESAELGAGNKGRRYTVRTQPERHWTERLPFGRRSRGYSFTIPARDEAGLKALDEVRGRGINSVANAVAQSADHVKSFFAALRLELAFYLGCVNLREQLVEDDRPVCFPEARPESERALDAEGLYDPGLVLHVAGAIVGNDLHADGKGLLVITGANQGGKSTLLRSLGIAQLMTQSGMFVAAQSFRTSVSAGVFTHFKREEDAAMEGGKLDEELRRMSELVDEIRPGALLLCNESFASTNEREGSEIARQVVHAMLDSRVRVAYVTHMYDLAEGFQREQSDATLFLRAERRDDGQRTFKLLEGDPQPTSYGEDSFRRIFALEAR
jgi:hypothetical protein